VDAVSFVLDSPNWRGNAGQGKRGGGVPMPRMQGKRDACQKRAWLVRNRLTIVWIRIYRM